MISTPGRLERVEVLANSDRSKDQAALACFARGRVAFSTSAGATTPPGEMFMTIEFTPSGH